MKNIIRFWKKARIYILNIVANIYLGLLMIYSFCSVYYYENILGFVKLNDLLRNWIFR